MIDLRQFLAGAFLLLSAMSALAADIGIEGAVLREPPSAANVAGGYAIITNGGDTADRLIGAEADFAERVEIHRMAMKNGVMSMEEIEGGLEIPGNGKAVLKPGANHLMFMGLLETPAAGETRSVTLHFEQAGRVEVPFEVWTLSDTLKLRNNE